MMHDDSGHSCGHLEAMIIQESKYWKSVHAQSPATEKVNPYRAQCDRNACGLSRKVNESWRISICQWYFLVADRFDFDRAVVSIALNYLDRVVAETLVNQTFASNKELQLAAITALYLAIKLHGEMEGPRRERKKLRIDAFVILSKNQFDVAAIESMERTVLSILDWHLNPPDAISFMGCMLEQMPDRSSYDEEWRCIFEIARYMTELSLGESDFTFLYKPSVVAAAAILCAINSLEISGHALPPIQALEGLSDTIAAATSLRLDSNVVVEAASRLMLLCPSLFTRPRRKRKAAASPHSCQDARRAKMCSSPPLPDISIDEIVDAHRETPRKTSPVCVGAIDDHHFFYTERLKASAR